MNVLFFGIDYHTYTRSIVAEMENLGARVSYVDIQPRNLRFKFYRTLDRRSYERHVHRRLAAAVAASAGEPWDKIVFLQAHQVAPELLGKLRDLHPRAEFTLYNWDALSNHDYRLQAPYFDRVLTFDRRDAEAEGYGYLPLFCQRSLQGLRRDRADPDAIQMVGNIVNPSRYEAVAAFRDYCKAHAVRFDRHLKMTPVVLGRMLRSGVRPRGITLRAIAPAAYGRIIEGALGVFDFANHAQAGQTMRMMESLCCGKKIVTNNRWVNEEPFYSADRIHVFDNLDFTGVAEFLHEPLRDPDADFPEYHIQTFTCRMLGLEPPGATGAGKA